MNLPDFHEVVSDLKVIVLTVRYEGDTDIFYLITKGNESVLLERILSDTDSEKVAICADIELEFLLKKMDVERLRKVLEIEYGPGVEFEIEEFEGAKAKLLVQKLAEMGNLEAELFRFLQD